MDELKLRQLNRKELIELLLDQKKKNDRLEEELKDLKEQLEKRDITIAESGSIAEAALKLSGIFEAAQKAADEYLYNVRLNYYKGTSQDEEL